MVYDFLTGRHPSSIDTPPSPTRRAKQESTTATRMEEERKVRQKRQQRQQRQQEDGDGDDEGDDDDEEESDEESHAKDENLRRFLKGWARRLRCNLFHVNIQQCAKVTSTKGYNATTTPVKDRYIYIYIYV